MRLVCLGCLVLVLDLRQWRESTLFQSAHKVIPAEKERVRQLLWVRKGRTEGSGRSTRCGVMRIMSCTQPGRHERLEVRGELPAQHADHLAEDCAAGLPHLPRRIRAELAEARHPVSHKGGKPADVMSTESLAELSQALQLGHRIPFAQLA
eukprot:scaffold229290_cov28-Tisochrysis_lutea.AAC.9